MDHALYVVHIWKTSSAYALGASLVWYSFKQLMKSFNKSKAAMIVLLTCDLTGVYNRDEMKIVWYILIGPQTVRSQNILSQTEQNYEAKHLLSKYKT